MRDSNDNVFPPIPPPWGMPFYYSSLSSFMLFYKADADTLNLYLRGTGLKVARFSDIRAGLGVVSIEFQNYTAQGSNFMSVTSEVEFNIVCYPEVHEHLVAAIPFSDYVAGLDQTKWIGGFRIFVPCDNKTAIAAGQQVFGEQKFYTTFDFNVPSLNAPGSERGWNYTVYDPGYTPPATGAKKPSAPEPEDIIYGVDATIPSLDACANPSPQTLYSMYPNRTKAPSGEPLLGARGYEEEKGVKLTASRWNILGTFRSYFPAEGAQTDIRLTVGKSPHPMGRNIAKILGPSPRASAVRIFQSPPAAIENRSFYVIGDSAVKTRRTAGR